MAEWLFPGLYESILPSEPLEDVTHVKDKNVSWLQPRVQELIETDLDDPEPSQPLAVPTVFDWTHGGNQVHLLSNLDNWQKKLKLCRSTNDFSTVIELPVNKKIQYRFEVDGRLMCDPEQKIALSCDGGYVNELIVKPNHDYSFIEQKSKKRFSQEFPNFNNYHFLKPQDAPCHFREIELNRMPKYSVEGGSSHQLARSPNHVTLNHVYISRKSKDTLVLAMSQRYKEKTFTTVYYKQLEDSND